MSLPNNLFSRVYRQHRLGAMFMMVTAIMVYLATLAMAVQTAIAGSAFIVDDNLHGQMTIEIPATEKDNTAQLNKILTYLKNVPEIAQITPLPQTETVRLLKPWINDTDVLQLLPVPTLVDIQIADHKTLTAKELRGQLNAIMEGIKVDDKGDWLVGFLQLVNILGIVAWATILMTVLALVITILLLSRAIVAVQHDTIELLHLMGATDKDIARKFQFHALCLSLPGVLIGFLLAAATIFGIGSALSHFLMTSLALEHSWIYLSAPLATIPLLSLLTIIITARSSAFLLLRRTP